MPVIYIIWKYCRDKRVAKELKAAQRAERSLKRAKRKADLYVAYREEVERGGKTMAEKYGIRQPQSDVKPYCLDYHIR